MYYIIEDRLEKEEENELSIDSETKLIQFPPAWDSIFPMVCCVSVPMHSLFLGYFQSLLKLIKKYFISRNCLKEFGDVVSTSFMHVSSLNLEWLKVLPYNKNGDYGSYLSENYMGLARICKWIYLLINLITKIV